MSVADLLSITNRVGAGNVKVVLTIGSERRGEGLSMPGVQELWADLEEAQLRPRVGKVTGLTDDDQTLPVNLLEGKMVQQVDLRYAGPNPRVRDIFDALDRAYKAHRDDIYLMFSGSGGEQA